MPGLRHLLVAAGICAAAASANAEQAGEPATRQTVTPMSAISGVVTDAITKRHLAGATVSLRVDAQTAALLRPPPVMQTLTDEKGRFVFWPLEARAGYYLNASAIGYSDGGYGRDAGSDSGRRVTLVDRQWFDRADVELRRPGAISGRVLDERGDPVVGVLVRAMRVIHMAGRQQLAGGPTANTDDRGAYRIAGLQPGPYLIIVPSTQMAAPAAALAPLAAKMSGMPSAISPQTTADPMLDIDGVNRLVVGRHAVPPMSADGRLMAYPIAWHPGTPSAATATIVEVGHGDRTGVDVRLQPTRAVTVSGMVEGPGDVIAKMTLRLVPAGNEGLGLGAETATALVAPNGSFTFLNVPAGEYMLDARGTMTEYEFDAGSARYNMPLPPGMTSTGSSAMSLSTGTPGAGMATVSYGPDRHFARLAVVVGERDISNLAVTVHATGTLRGRLAFEGQSPRPEMFPFIIAEPATGDASLGQPRNSNRSGDSTEFVLEGLLPGEYFLRVRGTNPWIVKSISSAGRDYTDTPFDAAGGRHFTDVVITLIDRQAVIEGMVTTSDGRPAPAATVIAFPVDREQWVNYGLTPHRIRTARITNTGSYCLAPLPAGEYFVVAVDDAVARMWHDPAFFEAAVGSASRVKVDWGGTAGQNLRLAEVTAR